MARCVALNTVSPALSLSSSSSLSLSLSPSFARLEPSPSLRPAPTRVAGRPTARPGLLQQRRSSSSGGGGRSDNSGFDGSEDALVLNDEDFEEIAELFDQRQKQKEEGQASNSAVGGGSINWAEMAQDVDRQLTMMASGETKRAASESVGVVEEQTTRRM